MSAAHAHDEPGGQRRRAQAFVERGWFPFPVEYGGKRPGVGIKWGTATASVPTPKMLDLWFGRDPMNIGIAARPSGLVILDEDRLGAMVALCEAYGHPVPITYRVRTAKGWHWYFDAPDDVEIGNSPGLLKDFGFDVRGGRGDGGYVVAAGSLHETGHVYVAEDDDADTVALPWWIVGLLGAKAPAEPVNDSRPAVDRGSGLFDERRQFTLAEAQEFVRPVIEELRAAGRGEINEALNRAARTVAHFGEDFWTRPEAERRLLRLQLRPWHDADESGARATIASAYASQARDAASGARDRAGQLLGWRAELVERGDPFGGGESEEEGDDEEARLAHAAKLHEEDVARELHRLQVREEATQRLRTEIGADPFVESELHRLQVRETAQRQLDVANLPDLAVLDAEEFLSAAMPEWLVRGFLYRASTAKVYGPPGGTKSFFLLDIALHLATGKRWQGRNVPRTTVHYVMAEGQAVNTLRAHGWLAHHGIDEAELKGWFTAIPQGILLTPEGIERYLQVVEKQQPGLVILDTKNRMMVGEENSASDVAVMVRAMDAIRGISGACVCLVDHTGILDQSRGRGSNAVTAAMDSEVRVGVDGIVATAEVTRDKAGVTGEKISYRLVTVEDVETPEGIRKPAVCEPVDAAAPAPNPAAEEAWQEWRNPALWPLPADVLELSNSGTGKKAIPDVARYMRHFAGNQDTAGRARNEMCRDLLRLGTYSDDTVLRAAWDRLLDAERIWNIQTKSRTAATHWMARPSDPAPATREDGHAPDHETP